MPAEVIETIVADAPPKTPVDVVTHEAQIDDFETYKAAKKGEWQPKAKGTEAAAKTEDKPGTPTETKQVSEGEEPSSEAEAKADSESGTEQTETTQEKAEGKGKKKNPIAPRIDELVKQRDIVRDENRQLKARIEELEQLPQAPATPDTGEPKKPTRPKAPNPLDAQFTTTAEYNVAHEAYEKALDKYETDLQTYTEFSRSKTQREEAVKQQTAAIKARFQASVAKAIEDNRFGDDFKPFADVKDGGPPVSNIMADILPRLEDPPAVMNYLQRNPKFAEALHDVKDPQLVIYQLARLEGILIGTEKAAKAAAKAETSASATPPEAKAPEKPATLKPAQKPPVTLNGSSGEVPVKDLNEANDYEEYKRLRAATRR